VLQNINGGDNNAKVKLDSQGNILFPGQFTIGSVGGTASDNHYNLGSADASKKISILDSHNNHTNVYCGDSAAPATHEGTQSKGDSTFSNEQLDTNIDLELPNHSHVIINQQDGKLPRVSSPEGVSVTNANDGGLDIKFGGTTIHEKDGSITSNAPHNDKP
jgi:hypothetical protein